MFFFAFLLSLSDLSLSPENVRSDNGEGRRRVHQSLEEEFTDYYDENMNEVLSDKERRNNKQMLEFQRQSENNQPKSTTRKSGSIKASNKDFKEKIESYLTGDQQEEYNRLYNKFKGNSLLIASHAALERALAFYVKHHNAGSIQCHSKLNSKKIRNKKYILITDYTIPHPQNRFFILHLESGKVTASPAAHGYGSNSNASCPKGYRISCAERGIKCTIPVKIGNTQDSGKTSRGFYITHEPYRSYQETFIKGWPRSLPKQKNAIRLDGLEYGINNKARQRYIVLHRANYYKNLCSNSAGCPAIQPIVFEIYKNKLVYGTLFYIHTIDDKNKTPPNCVGTLV